MELAGAGLLRVAALQPPGRGAIGSLLAEAVGLDVMACAQLDEVALLVDRHQAQAVVAPVDLPGDEWPASVAARLEAAVPPGTALVLICLGINDAELIKGRSPSRTTVVVQGGLTPQRLATLVRGAVARSG